MLPRRIARTTAFVAVLLAARATAQQTSTQDFWAIDFNASSLKAFTAAGDPLGALPLAGTGSARGLSFSPAGLVFVAQGQDVRTYTTTGATALFAGTTQGVDQAQDVAVRPGLSGEVWVACGTTTTNSKILRLTSAGGVVASLTNPLLNHPRRITWNSDGSILFVACAGSRRIVTLTPTTGAFAQLADLTSQNINPIGLSFDPTRGAVWVTGDYGASAKVGFVAVTGGAYTNVLNAGQIPGLAAPANLWFDRFRILHIAGRNQNGGIGGIYNFNAATGSILTPIGVVTTGVADVIDVRGRPEVASITAPGLNGSFVLNASSTQFVTNAIAFDAPGEASHPYAAALSGVWPSQCAPYIQGILAPELEIPGPDTRGIPLLADYFFRETAAVCCAGAVPPLAGPTDPPLFPLLVLSGFLGTLDAQGHGVGSIGIAAGLPPAMNGVMFSCAFITVDTATSSAYGVISDPICLTVALGP